MRGINHPYAQMKKTDSSQEADDKNIQSDSGVEYITQTTHTTQTPQDIILAYAENYGYPRVELSDGTIIPCEGWQGFIKYQTHKHKQAYEDIVNRTVKIVV
jgi:hypothetical protein